MYFSKTSFGKMSTGGFGFVRFAALVLLFLACRIDCLVSVQPNVRHRPSEIRIQPTKFTTSLNLWATSFSDLPEQTEAYYLSENNLERSLALLEDAVAFNSDAASKLLQEINEMRERKIARESIDEYLDFLLSAGPDARLPAWAKLKRLGRFSRRARLRSLRRTLDLTTPPATDMSKQNAEEQDKQRRRRALLALLNSIAKDATEETKVPIIISIERKAKEASLESSSDLRNRLPEGLESPEYDVLTELQSSKAQVEVRRYKPFSVCAVSITKPRPEEAAKTDAKLQMPEMKGASAFGALAGYLFGKNDKSTAMKMTTPVFTSPGSESADDQQMAFVLPSTYWSSETIDTAPQPLSGSGVTLQQRDSEDRVVLMFGGYASRKEVEKRKKELKDVISKNKDWQTVDDDVAVAQYNDPFTVPWRRLNEVSMKVVRKGATTPLP